MLLTFMINQSKKKKESDMKVRDEFYKLIGEEFIKKHSTGIKIDEDSTHIMFKEGKDEEKENRKKIKSSLLENGFMYRYGKSYNQLKDVLKWFEDNTDIKWYAGENPTNINSQDYQNGTILYYNTKSLSYFTTDNLEDLKKHNTIYEYDEIWESSKEKRDKRAENLNNNDIKIKIEVDTTEIDEALEKIDKLERYNRNHVFLDMANKFKSAAEVLKEIQEQD